MAIPKGIQALMESGLTRSQANKEAKRRDKESKRLARFQDVSSVTPGRRGQTHTVVGKWSNGRFVSQHRFMQPAKAGIRAQAMAFDRAIAGVPQVRLNIRVKPGMKPKVKLIRAGNLTRVN